ncbi:pyridoxamine 5'-phosphate oxidase family protein [Herpetosiphon giganteus]|uniref:pyridoxamine 5'-phosphate oxidase family protein n=1 Tax=Herpetosiphon giganteus TaxID=2029754 RepID=UPI001958F5E9|nr:pyridoxamine 5'-phosphate oxidase family protein [Herpetosiphon giganteus]MBM7844350.1 hypothetical protein [Herpetosiphon giganteus]
MSGSFELPKPLDFSQPVAFEMLLEHAWRLIEHGVHDRHDPLHTPVLGTSDEHGSDQRVVVLRGFDPTTRRLWFHSDLRSPKIGLIERDPRVSWLLYHPAARLQLRIRALAEIHTNDGLVEAAWQKSAVLGRRCYCGLAPGQISNQPNNGLNHDLLDREPTLAESEAGRPNFCLIATTIHSLDWLQLQFNGNYRAQFSWADDGSYTAQWVTP